MWSAIQVEVDPITIQPVGVCVCVCVTGMCVTGVGVHVGANPFNLGTSANLSRAFLDALVRLYSNHVYTKLVQTG